MIPRRVALNRWVENLRARKILPTARGFISNNSPRRFRMLFTVVVISATPAYWFLDWCEQESRASITTECLPSWMACNLSQVILQAASESNLRSLECRELFASLFGNGMKLGLPVVSGSSTRRKSVLAAPASAATRRSSSGSARLCWGGGIETTSY